jgi:hypothetical protein
MNLKPRNDHRLSAPEVLGSAGILYSFNVEAYVILPADKK